MQMPYLELAVFTYGAKQSHCNMQDDGGNGSEPAIGLYLDGFVFG